MYLVVGGKPNGEVTYFGPFPTEDRAREYGISVTEMGLRWHIAPLVVPNCMQVTAKLRY
jgi:hypothetical protein